MNERGKFVSFRGVKCFVSGSHGFTLQFPFNIPICQVVLLTVTL